MARVLLTKAIEDEVLVRTVVENPDIGDAIVGFHGQQAVEKLAKAVLTAHRIAFAKTHDLDYLIDLVEKNGIVAPDELESAEALSVWAVESRYDDGDTSALDRRQTLALLGPLRTWAEQEIETLASPPGPSEEQMS
ncbi:MAG TPA: HEPN domain-containing protein [Solirubrobacteraceae bacterium]|nr:HEPN domain-containing protein [Solirubrobacteraceae bacterium]